MHSGIYKNLIYSAKHNNKMPCCLDVVDEKIRLTASAILIIVIYSNGIKKWLPLYYSIFLFLLILYALLISVIFFLTFMFFLYINSVCRFIMLIYNKSSQLYETGRIYEVHV